MIVRRLAGQLIRLACRKLPGPDRALRCQEWTAEVAAILDGQQARWLHRQVTAVLFAADHIRGARRMARRVRRPAAEWRVCYPAFGTFIIALLWTHWLPLAHPARLALVEVTLAAGMVLHVIRERRYWLAGSKEEFDSAHAGRMITVITWWLMLCMPLATGVGWLVFAGCYLPALLALRPLERRIFTRPGLPSAAARRPRASSGPAPARA